MKRHLWGLMLLGASAVLPCAAVVPPIMGWSTWNTFEFNINEDVVKQQAAAMIQTGLAKAGYRYVNIDDGYWDGRDAQGRLVANPRLFPHGMRALTDHLHKLGLKAGIYSDGGDDSCGAPNDLPQRSKDWGRGIGFAGHEQEDCHTYFDDWGFDFIKVDFCGGQHMRLDEREQYTKISNAIRATRKHQTTGVVFNVCRWGYPGTWVSDIANSWRTAGDIHCHWPTIKRIIRNNLYIQAYTRNGHYNDPDMLEIGRTLSPDEENTHMIYWCIASSPLLIGCDMTTIPEHSLNLMKNKDLIAMNQDKLGIGAPVVQRQGEVYVVAKDMHQVMGPKRAVAVMNLTDEVQTIDVELSSLGFTGAVKVYDCLTHRNLPKATDRIKVTIPAHGSQAYFVTGKRIEQKVYQAEEAWCKLYNEIGKKPTPMWLPSETADQGEYVGYLGKHPDNYLEWPNVYSQTGGRYLLGIRYATAEPRNMVVSVNGAEVQAFNGLNTGDYINQWRTVTVEVTLRKGQNTVRLSNATLDMPNIDCMSVQKLPAGR